MDQIAPDWGQSDINDHTRTPMDAHMGTAASVFLLDRKVDEKTVLITSWHVIKSALDQERYYFD